jgi:hypothetical protein
MNQMHLCGKILSIEGVLTVRVKMKLNQVVALTIQQNVMAIFGVKLDCVPVVDNIQGVLCDSESLDPVPETLFRLSEYQSVTGDDQFCKLLPAERARTNDPDHGSPDNPSEA